MLDQSLQNKRLVINLDEQIDLLQNRIDTLKGVKSKADEEIHKKAKKRMRMIMGFYLLQIFAMQYGTYSLFCWDIMEPIACLLESFDMIIAYIFWLSTQEDFELDAVEERMISNRTSKIYRRHGFNVANYKENQQMLDYLKKRKYVLSDNIDHVLEALNYDKSFKK